MQCCTAFSIIQHFLQLEKRVFWKFFESSALFGILTPFQFLQDQLVDLVDIAAAQCDYQVSRLCVVADILCHLVEVLILALVSGLRIAFVLREPDRTGVLFTQLPCEDVVGVLFPGTVQRDPGWKAPLRIRPAAWQSGRT